MALISLSPSPSQYSTFRWSLIGLGCQCVTVGVVLQTFPPEDLQHCNADFPPEDLQHCNADLPPEDLQHCNADLPPEDLQHCNADLPPEDLQHCRSSPFHCRSSRVEDLQHCRPSPIYVKFRILIFGCIEKRILIIIKDCTYKICKVLGWIWFRSIVGKLLMTTLSNFIPWWALSIETLVFDLELWNLQF